MRKLGLILAVVGASMFLLGSTYQFVKDHSTSHWGTHIVTDPNGGWSLVYREKGPRLSTEDSYVLEFISVEKREEWLDHMTAQSVRMAVGKKYEAPEYWPDTLGRSRK